MCNPCNPNQQGWIHPETIFTDPDWKNSQSELDTFIKYSPVGIKLESKTIMCIDHHEGTENLEMLSLEDATGEWNQVYSAIFDIQN